MLTSTSGEGGGSSGEDYLHNIPFSDIVPVEDTANITTSNDDDNNATANYLGEAKTKTVVVEEPDGGFSPRAKAIATTSKVTGGLSMICSSYLIYYILIRGGHVGGGGGRTRNNTRMRRKQKQTGDEQSTPSSPPCCSLLVARRRRGGGGGAQQQVQEHHQQPPPRPSTPGKRLSSSLRLLSDLSLTNGRKKKKTTTYQRLIVMLCICDFIASFGYFLSTWPLPEGNNFGAAYDYGNDVAMLEVDDGTGGTGGVVTFSNPLCTAQGVFLHWGLTTALCNVVLSTHYILVVRYKFTERALRKAEPYYMSAIVLIGLIFISIPLALGTYGFNPYR